MVISGVKLAGWWDTARGSLVLHIFKYTHAYAHTHTNTHAHTHIFNYTQADRQLSETDRQGHTHFTVSVLFSLVDKLSEKT